MARQGRRIGTRLEGRLVVALSLAAAGLACGGDDAKKERVASMVQAPVEEGEAPADRPPAIESIAFEPARPVVGRRVRAKARLQKARGPKATIAYLWQTSSGRELGRDATLETQGLDPGTVVEVVATPEIDGKAGESLTRSFTLAAEGSQIALVVIDAKQGKSPGSILRADVETTDESDGFDAVAVEWRVGGKKVGDELELDTTPFAPGDVVELVAVLGDAENGQRIHAEPIVLDRGAPPAIDSQPTAGIDGGLFRYAVQASSPVPGAELHFELLKGPEGMVVDATTGVVEWRPAQTQRGRFEVEVAAKDQWGSGVAQRFTINADPPGAPPAAPQ